jgi:AmmeMemoRadiSam system protein B
VAQIREPALAGQFYPNNPVLLQQQIDRFLEAETSIAGHPKALIVPHAGYIYSGSIAACAYAQLISSRNLIKRVVLLGPAHRVGFSGLAVSSAQYFATPLGVIPLDLTSRDSILMLPQVHVRDDAHEEEHSIEVQLPFLQTVLNNFKLIPLVVGDTSYEEVTEVLEKLWGGDETVIVISSDLSHFHDYRTAQSLDTATSQAIEELRPDDIHYEQACGRNPINGLLVAARRHRLSVTTLDLRNSGDTAGSRDRVVGYGAYAFQ